MIYMYFMRTEYAKGADIVILFSLNRRLAVWNKDYK